MVEIKMANLEKSIEMNVKPQDVFKYLKDFENMTEWNSGFKSVKVTSAKKEGVGVTAHMVTELSGREMEFDMETTTWVDNKNIAWKSGEPMKSVGGYVLEQTGAGTKLAMKMDYELPYSV
ncbi:unnamed protein product, partial [marine sediment metagenome]